MVLPAPQGKAEPFWADCLPKIDFAFQPIIHLRTKELYGYEALLRNCEKCGYSISEFFQKAYEEKTLFQLELDLRERVIEKFSKIRQKIHQDLRLFLNIDNRVLEMPDYLPGKTIKALARHQLEQSTIILEISEQHRFTSLKSAQEALLVYRQQGYRIALDDYGTGYSGMQVLYYADPNIIKLDRFFIRGIAENARKKLFMSSLVNLAHTLGSLVVAEGIETEEEFATCLDIGCDLAQGYFIQRPEVDIKKLATNYNLFHHQGSPNAVTSLASHDLADLLLPIRPIKANSQMSDVFDLMQQQKEFSFFPVVNEHNEALGVIFDRDLKQFLYSPYGRSLLSNKNVENSLQKYIKPVPQAEYNQSIESIQQGFSSSTNESEVMIINLLGKYLGCLASQTLLQVISEQNLAQARDLNPLTHLPGNHKIQQYLNAVFKNFADAFAILYLDMNNFKAYNDRYGFEKGDQVIIMMADIIREYEADRSFFIGHIGGDDFFLGVRNKSGAEAMAIAKDIQKRYNQKVKPFFDKNDIAAGSFVARDRGHSKARFDLTSLSCTIIYFKPGNEKYRDAFSRMVAEGKYKAKRAKDKLYFEEW